LNVIAQQTNILLEEDYVTAENVMQKMKQVIVMREDLGMSPGKLAAQACHASLLAYEKADKDNIDEWKRTGVTKIVLGASSEHIIFALYKIAVSRYLPVALIADEGRTELIPGTVTGVGIGPAPSEQIDEVTGHLHLYGKDEEKRTDTIL
jgi:PTH2 family peptidyl-tRNA hydrolase